jgi:hypothetical protein
MVFSTMLATVAFAQSPPTPPSRFVGSVRVDGANATAGTTIEARIGATTCGVTTVFAASGEARYALDSPALEPTQNPNCGTDGSVVTFFVGGRQANETGTWRNYQLNTVNLTVTTQTTPTTPGATPTRTPAAPVAGTTGASTSGASMPLMELMLVASALGLVGVGIAARVRK